MLGHKVLSTCCKKFQRLAANTTNWSLRHENKARCVPSCKSTMKLLLEEWFWVEFSILGFIVGSKTHNYFGEILPFEWGGDIEKMQHELIHLQFHHI